VYEALRFTSTKVQMLTHKALQERACRGERGKSRGDPRGQVLGPQVLQVLQVLQGGARTRLRRLRMRGGLCCLRGSCRCVLGYEGLTPYYYDMRPQRRASMRP